MKAKVQVRMIIEFEAPGEPDARAAVEELRAAVDELLKQPGWGPGMLLATLDVHEEKPEPEEKPVPSSMVN